MPQKYTGIHYLRGFAALLVIIYHSMLMKAAAPYFNHPKGEFGVDIFFVISGFVMWVSTEGRQTTPLKFILLRLLRIAPLYWLISLSIVLASIILPTLFFQSRGIDFVYIFKSLLFIPARNPDVGDITPFYTIGWTLVYEMYFYCLFALCLLVNNLRARIALFAIVTTSLSITGKLFPSDQPVYFTYTNPLLLEFLAGVLLGFYRDKLFRIKPSAATAMLTISSLSLFTIEANQASRVVLYGIPAVLLVASFVALESTFQRNRLRLPHLLGEASYSLYLSHPISQRAWYIAFITIFGPLISIEGAIAYAVGAVITGVLGGIICYYFVERVLSNLTASIARLTHSKNTPTNEFVNS